jgi:hypothetical protein
VVAVFNYIPEKLFAKAQSLKAYIYISEFKVEIAKYLLVGSTAMA